MLLRLTVCDYCGQIFPPPGAQSASLDRPPSEYGWRKPRTTEGAVSDQCPACRAVVHESGAHLRPLPRHRLATRISQRLLKETP